MENELHLASFGSSANSKGTSTCKSIEMDMHNSALFSHWQVDALQANMRYTITQTISEAVRPAHWRRSVRSASNLLLPLSASSRGRLSSRRQHN